MKKFVFAAAALAAFSVSTTTFALDTRFVRQIRAAGLPGQSFLGAASFTALGVDGRHCMYLMQWMSPFNPNDVVHCVLAERRTPVHSSCIVNSIADITSYVSSGPGAECSTWCNGFDNLGIAWTDVTLLAGEFVVSPVLQGVVIYPTALPLVLPIEIV